MISRQIYDNSLEYANDFQVKLQEKKKNYLFGGIRTDILPRNGIRCHA